MRQMAGRFAAISLVTAMCGFPGLLLEADAAGTPKSEVKIVNGVPRILINGEDAIRTINQIYYFPTFSRPDGSLVNNYRRGAWLSGVKQQVDEMPGHGANALVLQVWWAEMADERTIDFGPLDQAMKYAGQKGIRVVLAPKVDTMPPLWWAKENDFPDPGLGLPCIPQEAGSDHACIPREICTAGDPRCCSKPREELYCCTPAVPFTPGRNSPPGVELTADGLPRCSSVAASSRYKTCSDCETDSYGWKYSSPGWGGPRFQQDYAAYLKALLARYRDDPALVGWLLSLGPTGEDMYGPSYIILRMVYGDLFGNARPDQVLDYSDNAQRKFKEWIRTRYSSDAQLQQAWNDAGLTLKAVRLPDPRKLFKEGRAAQFPDNFFLHFFVELDALTQQGRDLYDFREQTRDQARSQFTKLFKDLDKQHILIYEGTNNDGIFNDPAINAIQGNNHVEYALSGQEESHSLAIVLAMNARHGKASVFGIESTGNNSGLVRGSSGQDRSGQKGALKHAAETILCAGGYFGYVSELEGAGGFLPTWNSEDKQILKEIAAFTPTKDCLCQHVPSDGKVVIRHTVGELVDRLGLQSQYRCPRVAGAPVSKPQAPGNKVVPTQVGQSPQWPPPVPQGQEKRMFPAQAGQPEQPSVAPGGGQGRPYCGDKICDEFEKANPGMCSEDCK